MARPHLWLRAETKPNEHRSALTPHWSNVLINDHGFRITVEKSDQRTFKDSEFEEVGCALVETGSWKVDAPQNTYVIGLKELPEHDHAPLSHHHIFFAHCYKNQEGWKDILKRFVDGKGVLLDLEFLQDDTGRRVAAFGFHAGFAGAAVGIDVWCQQHLAGKGNLPAIKPYPHESELIAHIKDRLAKTSKKAGGAVPRVMVMGAQGRCGSGAVDFVRKAGIPESNILQWDMAETAKGGPFKEITEKADIFINCIYLSEKIPPFVDQQLLDAPSRKLSVIVDVSCDTTNPNNPIPVYNRNTTFDAPTLTVQTSSGAPIDVVAIDHLPTLLPREASEAFCKDLLPSLIELKKPREESQVWARAEKLFREKIASL